MRLEQQSIIACILWDLWQQHLRFPRRLVGDTSGTNDIALITDVFIAPTNLLHDAIQLIHTWAGIFRTPHLGCSYFNKLSRQSERS